MRKEEGREAEMTRIPNSILFDKPLTTRGLFMTDQASSEVGIIAVENGFIVSVGCKYFVAKTWKEVSEGLAEYWKDPLAAKKKYCK